MEKVGGCGGYGLDLFLIEMGGLVNSLVRFIL